MQAIIILGNQLFPLECIEKHISSKEAVKFFMREDYELCSYYKFHQQKIVFFLTAMRDYCDYLEKAGLKVEYQKLQEPFVQYEEALGIFIAKNKIKKIYFFEIEDKFFESRIINFLKKINLDFEVWPSPMFLTRRESFQDYLKASKKPFMKVFYENQRKANKILIDRDAQPIGGKWSFDSENRLPLPTKILPPDVGRFAASKHQTAVIQLTHKLFSHHPGDANGFWLPTNRPNVFAWLNKFLEERLLQFGPYEDAIPVHSDFVFHSVLSPFLNCGLITPSEVVAQTLKYASKNKIPVASTEGFIRQVVGWREFIRGIYQNYSQKQETSNFFNHKKKLTKHWYAGNTGIAPLDNVIQKTLRFGYAHHIERLMVVGSLMLLLEVEPRAAHNWFMEMYIDSSDWVMGPNVYGMALFSDGGIFATKPYICGSNYYRKMGGYKASESWCDGVDGLYWSFIEKHKVLFSKNPRTSMMVKTVEKMNADKKQKIYVAAEVLRKKLTI